MGFDLNVAFLLAALILVKVSHRVLHVSPTCTYMVRGSMQ